MFAKHLSSRRNIFIIVVAVLILMSSGIMAWCREANSPKSVFDTMLRQSLVTRSVAVNTLMSDSGTKLNQAIQVQFAPYHIATSTNILESDGNSVTNQIISTPQSDYIKYTALHLKSDKAKSADFSRLLGVWAKKDIQNPTSPKSASSYEQFLEGYSAGFGSIVPLASLRSEQAMAVMNQIRASKMYNVDFRKAKRVRYNNRAAYQYTVTVNRGAQLAVIKNISQLFGFNTATATLNPHLYDSQTATVSMIVDIRSKHVVKVSSGDKSVVQQYSGYDAIWNTRIPSRAITFDSLQTRFLDALNNR